jgi:hypothetical protein
MFALKFDPPIIQRNILAAAVVAGGILNICFYPIYWKYQRRKQNAAQNAIPREANPEEVIYGMNTQHIKNNVPAQAPPTAAEDIELSQTSTQRSSVTSASTPSDSPASVEKETDAASKKSKEPETKGKEPETKGKEPETKKFADEVRITVEPLGVGAC